MPDVVRAEMAGLEGTEGRACGIRLAKEIAAAALSRYSGLYLITPFLHYDTTIELSEFARTL